MSLSVRFAIAVPGFEHEDKYFSIKLKNELFNERSVYQKADKILVLSNIEGDFEALRRLLFISGVMNKKFQWTFGDGHLVVLGDCLDGGEQMMECLWLLYGLEEKAVAKGGCVHFIMGDHEISNMNGDWRFKHPRYAKNVKKRSRNYAALFDGNNELWRWLKTKNIIEKIGDYLFVHSGISSAVNQIDLTIEEINQRARSHYSVAGAEFSDLNVKVLFDEAVSPFFYTGYHTGDATMYQLNDTLKKFGVSTIVTSHEISSNIRFFLGGKVISVNAEHGSDNYKGLLIKKNRYYCVNNIGRRSLINESP